ncbi:diguanylate cyclase domain-containing protein [Azospirillum soli]|uniref:diguanylate cyclase domain-containing protein n=1 Tax=Azospirillum soli TaxID=1304799 RepID=UPI001AE63D8B|nr:diguanylate cyclase [Azospirillum soli]MBP2313336.1 diguanylate cyclase (GGDEF)-like protein/PAS domain S-box-containing protein [Azospirillum soli]
MPPGPDGALPGWSDTFRALAFPIFMTALALVSVVGAFLFVQQQLLAPLGRLTGVMDRLASGDPAVEVPDLDRDDEVGAMARAVDVFKRNALALDRESAKRARLEDRVLTLFGAVEHSPVPILITDAKGVIEYVNPRLCANSGYTPDEVIGGRPSMFKSGHTPPETYTDLWRTILAGKEWKGEFYNRRKNGECYWEKTSIAPITGPDGRILHFVAVKEDITEVKDAERRAWMRAHYDPLTELPNRVLFEDRLNQAIARSTRSGKLLALMFVDLDRFKQVNDTLGHAAGDELLQEAALRLRACVRESDTVSRMGGDEFVVLLCDLNSDDEAAIVASRINTELAKPFDLDAGEARIGVSIGIAIYPRDGHTAASLMKNADAAMYWGKEGGRNTYRFFTKDPVAYLDCL